VKSGDVDKSRRIVQLLQIEAAALRGRATAASVIGILRGCVGPTNSTATKFVLQHNCVGPLRELCGTYVPTLEFAGYSVTGFQYLLVLGYIKGRHPEPHSKPEPAAALASAREVCVGSVRVMCKHHKSESGQVTAHCCLQHQESATVCAGIVSHPQEGGGAW
jgi:hypothetical protein